MGLPYMCLTEQLKTEVPRIGREYYVVPPELSVIEEDRNWIEMAGKTHNEVQRAASKEDQTYTEIMKFLKESLNI